MLVDGKIKNKTVEKNKNKRTADGSRLSIIQGPVTFSPFHIPSSQNLLLRDESACASTPPTRHAWESRLTAFAKTETT